MAHLTASADELSEQLEAALAGETTDYPGGEQHLEAVETGAAAEPARLKRELHRATERFADLARRLRSGASEETARCRFGEVSVWAVPMMRINEVLMGHHDLGTVWELAEADIDAQEDALEAAAQIAAEGSWSQPVTVSTFEGDEYSFGAGAAGDPVTVRGERAGVLGWLTRGLTDQVRCDGELPEPPYQLFL